ncbi:MAG: hypothetical protein BroJett011_05640 [Chloroflexota bacterium]|nr:MAG: hypothetical protein BroJett011_05640 [Chloroflexota bacterium]
MARKQKKLTRKERTQQQQALTERQRQAKGWISPKEKAKRRQELIEDMAPLMAVVETGAGSAEENLFWLLADSGDLAEEPEFREIFTEPLVTLPTYISVAESLGVATPDIMDELPEEEQADKKAEILEETIRRLLTNELRREIIEAVDRLRLRWKKEEKRAEAARAAGIQLTLSDRKSTAVWPMIGLVQAIVLRSLGAGFELVGVTMDEEENDANGDESLADLYEQLQDPGVDKKLEQAIKKVPGLQNYLEKQLDKIWEEGETAVFTGELYLELFSDEELEAGVEIFKAVLSTETTDANAPSEGPAEASIPQKSRDLFAQLDLYLAQRFTPARLEQLRTRLRTVLDEADYPPKYFSFVKMLADAMADEEAAENEKGFLLRALLGEIRAVSVSEDEEAEEADEE